MTTDQLEQSLWSLIKDAQERTETPDPNAVAELVAQDLDTEQLRKFAIRGIAERVRVLMFTQRKARMPSGSARWADAAEQHESGELDLARMSIWTGTDHVWLLDAGPVELDAASAEHGRMARGHESSADQLQQLAQMLRRRKRAAVRDLPERAVKEVFNA